MTENEEDLHKLLIQLKAQNRPQNWLVKHWHVLASVGSVCIAIILLFPRVDAIEKKINGFVTKNEMAAQFQIRDIKADNIKSVVKSIKQDVKDNNKMLQQILREMPRAQ